MAKTRIAINGFGRIGRAFFKAAIERAPELEIIAVNDLGDLKQLTYLLKHDSIYGKWEKDVQIEGNDLIVGGKKIKFIQEEEPAKIPWRDLNIDVVLESTGIFESFEKAKVHLDAGAKRVVISAPAKDEDNDFGKTVLLGANEEDFKICTISSNGSCTTNSAHPIMVILSESLGIKKAFLVSAHGYTATQNLVDGPTKSRDIRRGRSAGVNIVPSFTGATIAVERAVKAVKDKFGGAAFRVPVITGSVSAITVLVGRPTTTREVNEIFQKAEKDERWQGVMKTTNEEIVSTDIISEPYGAVVDLSLTSVVDGDLVTVFSWYDNEAGYTETLVRHVIKAAETLI